ncbi:hypothetical protein [Phormidium pseudopriestleyi]|uniref:hypothetical protein n=1 Tax=Phormidium pseudopriestleyi TaxID=1759527 RepID=UPI001F5C7957|nr:hypothetical protein [Phormidium pseudopriestleyi]
MSDYLYAPSLYWFAYRYREGLVVADTQASSDQTLADLDWVKQQYKQVLSPFDVILSSKWQNEGRTRNFELLKNPNLEEGRQYEYFEISAQNLEGFVYPQSLHDSYGLNLNLFCPENKGADQYPIEDLDKLNPKGCFTPPKTPPFGYLGQTLLLTAYLDKPRPSAIGEFEALARTCWQQFFKVQTVSSLPRLYRAYQFLGGYLYEYGNPEDDLTKNPFGHLLIWFFFEEETSLILQRCYWELPELLLYYHKICGSFRQSRDFYQNADTIVSKNETYLQQLNKNYLQNRQRDTLADEQLTELKLTLKELLATSLRYSQQLRNLEYAHNTIAINHKNYLAILDQMEQLAQTPLEAFRVFGEKEAVAFQEQITADLNYFRHGSGLLDTAINSIRGLVEIDQAERDRLLQTALATSRDKQEKFNQGLQDQIQAVGVGIAAGAIVASTSGLITHSWQFPSREQFWLPPHPFILALLGSALCSWGAWLWAKKEIQKRRDISQANSTPKGISTAIATDTPKTPLNPAGDRLSVSDDKKE